MKRTPLKRTTPLRRGKPLTRSTPLRSRAKRNNRNGPTPQQRHREAVMEQESAEESGKMPAHNVENAPAARTRPGADHGGTGSMAQQDYRQPRACGYCGDVFTPHRGATRGIYCSRSCQGQGLRERAASEYPPKEEIERLYVIERLSDKDLGERYGHSHQWALSVRTYYGIPANRRRPKPLHRKNDRDRWNTRLKPAEACRNCGVGGKVLHLHHAVPRSLSRQGKYDLRNSIQLCGSCHAGWHSGIPIARDRFTAEEWEFISSLMPVSWLDRRYPDASSEAA